MAKKRMASLDDPHNTTTGNPPKKKNVSVKSDRGYDMTVKAGSPYAKQAKDLGAVVDNFRPSSKTEKTDPFSTKNVNAGRTKPMLRASADAEMKATRAKIKAQRLKRRS